MVKIDYELVDKLVENCKKLYPDVPDYYLWVLACDYYIKEVENFDSDDEEYEKIKEKGKEIFEKSKEELKSTLYENIKLFHNIFFLIYFIYNAIYKI